MFDGGGVVFQGLKGNKDEYSDSDEDQHDAYLERMKAEGKIREEANDSEESDGESGEWPIAAGVKGEGEAGSSRLTRRLLTFISLLLR